ncbi:MAG: TonB-dependent receptor [Bacteroidota bacterium]|nr:TonB-dependent receptor [Bacteroidota bacterium]
MDKVFENTDVSYSIKDRQILLINSRMVGTEIEAVSQQQKPVFGKVTDSSGSPLPGVSVVVKGTTTGTITDSNGNYSLPNVAADATISFSFIGLKTQEIAVAGKTTLNIKMQEEIVGIEEVVAVGYGEQRKGNLTGSIATVKSDQLIVAPLASITNTLAGRLPGLVSIQRSGLPGADNASLSIRGFGNALVIVDGIEGNFNNIDANEVESISVLKDGAASIYGSRAGNGVILVTTKRGKMEKPTITFNTSQTFQSITAMPKMTSAGQWAEVQTETWLQQGKPVSQVPYTQEQIQKYYDGSDPLQYPNTNWYNVLIREWSPQQQHNLSIKGGSDRIKFLGFLGYLNQETIWKKSGGDYKRYNFQSNIDAKILDNLSLQLDVASIVEDRNYPHRDQTGTASGTIWQDFWNMYPIYPSSLPDTTKIPFTGMGNALALSNMDNGYNNTDNQNIKGTLSLSYNFNSIKGLSAKALVNYSKNYSTNKVFYKPLKFYTYDYASKIYSLKGALFSKAGLSQSNNQDRALTGQFSLNYDHIFGENHHLTILALYEAIDYKSNWISAGRVDYLTPAIDQLFAGSTKGMSNNGAANEMGRKSYVGRLNYSFKDKYLVESTLRADASAKFPTSKRWGYFPSLSLGWRMSQENFLKNVQSLDNLKLRASYGSSGNDAVGNFQYLSGYNYGSTYLLGSAIQQGLVSTGLANPNLTWEGIQVYNCGIDFSMWKGKLYGEIDAFYRERTGIIGTRTTSLPSSFGAVLPPENVNSMNNRGFEINLGNRGNFRDLNWDISGNISWSRSKWMHNDEPSYTDPDQERIYKVSGRWTDRRFGYLSDGLFTSQAEIDALQFDQDLQGNKTLRPGDMRYKDVNGDGKLDWKDQVEIGKGTEPHWMIGFNTNLNYKNFDLSALFQGAMGYYTYIANDNGILLNSVPMFNSRWTEANNNSNAFVPRRGGNATNNYLNSDHYYKKAGYLRLKTLSIGYTISKKWLEKANISHLRIYAAGTNLLTFDKLKEFNLDPESPSGKLGSYYPQQKTITFGAIISL